MNIDDSLRKEPTFGDATTGFPAKWRLRNERRNSILMTRHYPIWEVLLIGWIKFPTRHDQSGTLPRSSVVTRRQYGISAFVSQESFGGETIGSVAKCRLFSQAISTTSSYLWYISRGPYHFSTIQTINYLFHFFKYQIPTMPVVLPETMLSMA